MNKIVVPSGGEYHLILSDGTEVFLNSETTLDYPVEFSDNVRKVVLSGEGFFRVRSSRESPFIVRTDGMDIRVTGTEFNVKAYPDEKNVSMTLLKGEVEVSVRSEMRVIRPSYQAEWLRDGEYLKVREVDTDLVTAWRNGRFIFRNERMEDIMRTLARWYDVEIEYVTEEVKDMRFAGSLDRNLRMDPVLDIMRATGKLKIERRGNKIFLEMK